MVEIGGADESSFKDEKDKCEGKGRIGFKIITG